MIKRYIITIGIDIDDTYNWELDEQEGVEKYIENGAVHLLSSGESHFSPKAADIISIQKIS
jgi:hypothetical protein